MPGTLRLSASPGRGNPSPTHAFPHANVEAETTIAIAIARQNIRFAIDPLAQKAFAARDISRFSPADKAPRNDAFALEIRDDSHDVHFSIDAREKLWHDGNG
ncbi:MAG: hypothetical protein IT350_06585 [Deltaproteobacteria bacterium]|nr:hypothetical protein [Deltaproteobacteria bacterium]